MTAPADRFKQQAGEQAACLVQSGMVIGLGTGSTAIFAIRRIAARLHTNDLHDILAIAPRAPARPRRARSASPC